MIRPGIKDETLAAAGIIHVDAERAEKLTGLAAPGLYIPYRTIDGHLVIDKEHAYGRLRLQQPRADQKYHQRAGSSVHAYIPPGLRDRLLSNSDSCSLVSIRGCTDLFVVEGEFKALALVEAGYAAIGISGFWGFAQGGGTELAPELLEVLTRYRPSRILYVGDSDTTLNADFSKAAVRFLELLSCSSINPQPSTINLPRIPLDGPGKGVDDVRDNQGPDFKGWWVHQIDCAVELDTKTTPGQLAVRLLEPQVNALKKLTGADRDRAELKLVKIAAAFPKEPLAQEKVAAIALKAFEVKPLAFRRAVATEIAANEAAIAAAQPPAESRRLVLPNVEPWPEPVDGVSLLNELKQTFTHYVVLPANAAEALALWTLHTYAYQQRSITAYLGIVSPEKRCGKTTLLTLLTMLVNRPLAASNVSTASIFRVVEEAQPTLLIDEADTFLENNEELRGILNAGHRRETAFVVRVEGEDHSLVKFSCWCPKAIAAIGRLPGTLADRCIIITMRRKTRGEDRPRLRGVLTEALKRKCARFVKDREEQVKNAQPTIPPELNDRSADVWEPLLALADFAGGNWPLAARLASVGLSGAPGDESIGTLLLSDVRDVFEERNTDRMFTRQLVEALVGLAERPWAELRRGKPISENWFSRELGKYGLSSRSVRIGVDTAKGYYLGDFEDAFSRYLAGQKPQNDAPPAELPLHVTSRDVSAMPGTPSNDGPCVAESASDAFPEWRQEVFL